MRKIAIVDDIKDSRDLLYYLLSEEYDVGCYESGDEALRDFAKAPPDLVIMDIWLNGVDGVEVFKQMKGHERLQNIPVIAVTADAMSGRRQKYLDIGFDEYVSKPILDMEAFMTSIRRFMDRGKP